MNTELKQRLLEMVEEDQRVRAQLAATEELFRGYAPKMAEVHRRNAQGLESVVEKFGWPGKSVVGEEASNAAWLILQHAIGNPKLQRRCLPILREEVAQGEAEPAHAAYLEDRICFFERRPQRYGTQFDWDENGQMSPWLLEDPNKVDEFRRSVGLPPLADRIEQARKGENEEPKPVSSRSGKKKWKRGQNPLGGFNPCQPHPNTRLHPTAETRGGRSAETLGCKT